MDLSGANPADYGIKEGVISMILNQVKPIKPKVQLIDFKEIGQRGDVNPANKRYRLMISDGKNKFAFAMIAPQMVHLIDDGTVTHYAVIELEEYVCNIQVQNNAERKILIITKMSLVRAGAEVGGVIGTPILMPDAEYKNGHFAMQPASSTINPSNQGTGVLAPALALPEYGLLLKENERLKMERTCKICLDANCEMSFQPCGHCFTCRKCSGSLDTCPICRTVIEKKNSAINSSSVRHFSPATPRLACCFTVSTSVSYPTNSIPNSRKISFRIRPATKSGNVLTDGRFRMTDDAFISATNSSPSGISFSLQVTVMKSKPRPGNLPQAAPGLTKSKKASRNSGEARSTGNMSAAVVSDCDKFSELRSLLKSVNSYNYMEISVLITDMPCYSNEEDVKQFVDALLDVVQGQDPESDQSHVYASLCCDILNFLLRQNKVLAAKFKSSLLWTTQNRLCNLTNDKRQFDSDKFPPSEHDVAREQFGTLKRFAVLLESEGIMSQKIAVFFRPWLTKVKVLQSDRLKLPAFQNSDEDGKRGF